MMSDVVMMSDKLLQRHAPLGGTPDETPPQRESNQSADRPTPAGPPTERKRERDRGEIGGQTNRQFGYLPIYLKVKLS